MLLVHLSSHYSLEDMASSAHFHPQFAILTCSGTVITLSVMTVPFVMFCYKITFKTSRNTTPAVPPRELMPSVHQLTASVTPVSVPSTLTANSAATPCKTLINSALSAWPERSIAPRITSAAAIPAT